MGCTVLMLLFFLLVGAPGAVNMHCFVWFLLSAIYKFSFIHSLSTISFERATHEGDCPSDTHWNCSNGCSAEKKSWRLTGTHMDFPNS